MIVIGRERPGAVKRGEIATDLFLLRASRARTYSRTGCPQRGRGTGGLGSRRATPTARSYRPRTARCYATRSSAARGFVSQAAETDERRSEPGRRSGSRSRRAWNERRAELLSSLDRRRGSQMARSLFEVAWLEPLCENSRRGGRLFLSGDPEATR